MFPSSASTSRKGPKKPICPRCRKRPIEGVGPLCSVCAEEVRVALLYEQLTPDVLYALRQEVAGLKETLRHLEEQREGKAGEGTSALEEFKQRLETLERGISRLRPQRPEFFFPKDLGIYLSDARDINNLVRTGHMGAICLSIAALFLGGLIQVLLTTWQAQVMALLATVGFGALAAWQYWEERRMEKGIRETFWRAGSILLTGEQSPKEREGEQR